MKKIMLIAPVVLILAAIVYLLLPKGAGQTSLRLYAGAGLRRAVDELASEFETRTGIRVDPDYGGSGLILSRVRDDQAADLFMPGDVWYVDRLEKFAPGRVVGRATVAYFVPTIIVAKGNPKGIKSLVDLGRSDIHLALGKTDACQVGRVSARILKGAGLDPAELKTQESLTVNELGVWVKMKTVDAAIVWDAIAANIADDVDKVAIPPEKNIISEVVLARLSGSARPEKAESFIKFVSGPDGQRILKEKGFRIDKPEIKK